MFEKTRITRYFIIAFAGFGSLGRSGAQDTAQARSPGAAAAPAATPIPGTATSFPAQ
jgi:hypothetical protein